jgi:outer membrane protein OmpA-like peptidoglycan-associated protein
MICRVYTVVILTFLVWPTVALADDGNFWGLSSGGWVCSDVGKGSDRTMCLPIGNNIVEREPVPQPIEVVAVQSPAIETPGQLTPADPGYFVQFPRGGVHLNATYIEHLRILALVLNGDVLNEACIRLIGHSDSVGGAAGNKAVARRRAEIVEKSLVDFGVVAGRISILSIGEEAPLENIPSSSAAQRRVEVLLADRGPECAG